MRIRRARRRRRKGWCPRPGNLRFWREPAGKPQVPVDGPPEKNGDINAAYVAVMAILAIIVLLGHLFVSIQFGSTTVWHLGEAATVSLAVLLIAALLIWGADRLIGKLMAWGVLRARQGAADKKFRKKASLGIYIAFLLVGFPFAIELMPSDLPILHVVFLLAVSFDLVFSLVIILSPSTRTGVTRPVQHPPGLSRWMDVMHRRIRCRTDPRGSKPDPRGSKRRPQK